MMPETMDSLLGPVVYAYTRAQALEDGQQVAIPAATSQEAGFKVPIFLTRTVWDQYVAVPCRHCHAPLIRDEKNTWVDSPSGGDVCGHAGGNEPHEPIACQDEAGRLWDVLWMLKCQLKSGAVCRYSLRVRTAHGVRRVWLKAMIGALDIDDPQPAITIMLPDED